MSDRYFIDTNIFVYCFEQQTLEKRERSLGIIADALQTRNGMISWQVIQEFLYASTNKFITPLTLDDAKFYLTKVLYPLCQIYPTLDLYSQALDIAKDTKYRFYDSLIIAASVQGGCKVLYTEDLQDGQLVNGVHIINPFLKRI